MFSIRFSGRFWVVISRNLSGASRKAPPTMTVSYKSQSAGKIVAGVGPPRTSATVARAAVAYMICSVMVAAGAPHNLAQIRPSFVVPISAPAPFLKIAWTDAPMTKPAPVMFAQANPTSAPQQAGGAVPLAKSPAVADWQTAAGGPMAFEVASIRPSKPGAGRSANFPLDDGDAYLPGGRFLARFVGADFHQFRLQTCTLAGASPFHGCRSAEMVH